MITSKKSSAEIVSTVVGILITTSTIVYYYCGTGTMTTSTSTNILRGG